MKKIITIAIIIITIIAIFFIKTNYKSLKFGNNMSNKTTEEIAQYILDINSYELTSNITIESNKNTNVYEVKEKYIKDNNTCKQEILEPQNVKGILTVYDGSTLKIENSNLDLSKIYENYPYIGDNTITLMSFINDYKESQESYVSENENEIILKTKLKNGNKYIAYKTLYIDKSNATPSKLEIQDITQKTSIYILYNEIKINNLQKEDILAFKLEKNANDI